ncbi:MAG: hypothetical protein ABF991_00640 [Liquorilactobacillus hordei]|uniref:hypothetical protein n=1 Tax=Liquorilactobacillus hordei TaxID=468911 RepID=UPI0039EA2F06
MNKKLIDAKEHKKKEFILDKENRRASFTSEKREFIKIKNKETFEYMQCLTGCE